MLRLAIFAAALALVPTAASAKSYAPRNECERVPEAAAFQRAFITAVANRDVLMLQGLVSDQVLLGFGGSAGPDTLAEWLAIPEMDLWGQLDEMSRLGCAVGDDGSVIIPWIWSQEVAEVDGIEGLVALGPDVPMRAGPSDDSRLVTRLNWAAVQLVNGWDGEREWLEVEVPGGARGFVRADQLRSLIARRLVAERVDGELKAVVLVAGD